MTAYVKTTLITSPYGCDGTEDAIKLLNSLAKEYTAMELFPGDASVASIEVEVVDDNCVKLFVAKKNLINLE